ncbi:ABC transporter permease [Phyllobacterium chamaecytisi]|uniref:ABC transporter permease n=1 Tax=Phyllobacterium chamaecytisi TaxID=2876082 RepID=UPI001CC92B92|nr:ABC transporter permease [Phyllobacterium sp. KW56]MBZ9603007.1 ABC transporter permease [Phyllobacterium sp. KW56]
MLHFILIRLARALLTILIMVTFAFVVLRVSGDPVLALLSPETPASVVEAFRQSWGLDQPLWVQYLRYLLAIVHGDLGQSMRDGRAAVVVVAERIPITLLLTVPALILNIAIGIPAGILAALKRDSFVDRAVMTSAIAGFTVPSFVLGLLLVLVFAVELPWLPSGGAGSIQQMILPVVTLGVGGAAVLARFTRSAMLEVLGEAYIRTGSAKGVAWRRVISGHALPNAAIPILTIIGFMIGNLIAGTVLVESVFSWPGLGSLLVVSVMSRDLAVVQCILLFVAAAMIIANVLVDLLYGVLDPRLRGTGRASGGA